MRLISFIGQEKGDFVYYIAQTLKTMENKERRRNVILCIDNSYRGTLYGSITRHDAEAKEDRIFEIDNLACVRGCAFSQETFDKFDYVLNFAGENTNDEIYPNSDVIYAMPDYQIESLDAINSHLDGLLDNEDIVIKMLMRDYCTNKVTDKAISQYTNIPMENIVGHIEVSEDDHKKFVALNHNGRQTIQGLTSDYIDALSYVIMQLTGIDEKKCKRLFKKAK